MSTQGRVWWTGLFYWSSCKQFTRDSIHSSTKLFEISISRRSNVIIRLFQSKMESAYESRLYYQFLYRYRMMGSKKCTCVVEVSSAFLDHWQTSKNFENFGFYFIQFWPRRLWISSMLTVMVCWEEAKLIYGEIILKFVTNSTKMIIGPGPTIKNFCPWGFQGLIKTNMARWVL